MPCVAGESASKPSGKAATAPASKPSGKTASAPASEPAESPYWKVTKFDYVNDYVLAVPKDWPQQQLPGITGAAFVGDGVAAPAKDEKGDTIQVDMSVNRYDITKDPPDVTAKQDQLKTTKQVRMPMPGLGQPQHQEKVISSSLEKLKLSDGTPAAFTRILMVKSGPRRSLQLKLFAKDKSSHGVVVSAWITTGMKTQFIDKRKDLERLLKAHMLTLCFDEEKFDTAALAKLYESQAASQPATKPAKPKHTSKPPPPADS